MNNPMIPDPPETKARNYKILWLNVAWYVYSHAAGLYGLYCLLFVKWNTVLFTIIMVLITGIGVTAGAHRLWSHKTYKAKLPLQIFLMICFSIASQFTVIHWCRDHRLHHKYSDTDVDPHNANRGFFYSHVGWLLVKKTEEVKNAGKLIELNDLIENPVLAFQRRHVNWLIPGVAFVIPSLIPMLWQETFSVAFHLNMLRYIYTLNATFMVNSAAHKWGNKPYDKSILPCESKTASYMTLGEGYHNYHHTFPQDYRAAELGNELVNFSTSFIDICAWFGWAYDRKSASEEMVRVRAKRTGDEAELWSSKIKARSF